MVDPFMLVAPILLLGVIALLGFIGCSILYNPDNIHPGAPAAPTNLQAKAGNAEVDLSWDLDTGPTSFRVKRGTRSGGPYPVAISVDAPATGLTDSPLLNGTPYFYVVTAVTSDHESGNSNEASATPSPVAGRPPGSVLDPSNPLASNLIGLYLMNEGTGAIDTNLVDSQPATFSGAAQPTWDTTDPSIVFHGGGSLNSFLDGDEKGAGSAFDQLPISQVTVVAKVFVNTLAAAGVCEKNDNNTMGSGFIFGWNKLGSLMLTVEKKSANMQILSNQGVITAGQWVQVAFTWDGTIGTAAAAHLFVNGVEQIKGSALNGAGNLGFANATNQPFRIGNASFDQIAGSLNGKIAYLAIYKGRILMPAEMNQLDVKLPIV